MRPANKRLLHLWALCAAAVAVSALPGAAGESDAAQRRTAATAKLGADSAKASAAAAETYMIVYHSVHAGKDLAGHEALIRSAGGEVVAVHLEIAVIVAKSRSSSFVGDVKKSDSRIKVCIKPLKP